MTTVSFDPAVYEQLLLAKDSLVKASTPEPFSTSKTSNWVAKNGGLPDYIQHLAHGILRSSKGKKTESEAIHIAIGLCENPPDNWDENAKAAARKAHGEWEALKAKNAAKKGTNMSQVDWSDVGADTGDVSFDPNRYQLELAGAREDLDLSVVFDEAKHPRLHGKFAKSFSSIGKQGTATAEVKNGILHLPEGAHTESNFSHAVMKATKDLPAGHHVKVHGSGIIVKHEGDGKFNEFDPDTKRHLSTPKYQNHSGRVIGRIRDWHDFRMTAPDLQKRLTRIQQEHSQEAKSLKTKSDAHKQFAKDVRGATHEIDDSFDENGGGMFSADLKHPESGAAVHIIGEDGMVSHSVKDTKGRHHWHDTASSAIEAARRDDATHKAGEAVR